MNSLKAFFIKALATCGYLTYLPSFVRPAFRPGLPPRATGAGFIGSLAGLLCARWLPNAPLQTAVVLAGGLAIAISVSDSAERLIGHVDDSRIVIDEWIGCLMAVAFLPHNWIVWIVGLVLFRIFDVWKPLGIHRLGDLPGGWGIVADDVLAGVYANLLLQAAHALHWL